MSVDRLAALDARGDQRARFFSSKEQADAYIEKTGTQELVDELRQAVADHVPIRMGTINTLVLLAHIDRLEAELGKKTLVKP